MLISQKISHFPRSCARMRLERTRRWGEVASGAGLGAPAPGWHVGWNRGNTEAFYGIWSTWSMLWLVVSWDMIWDLTWSYHCCQLWAIKCWELHGGIHDWMVVSWPCIQGNWIEWNWGVTNATMLGLEYHGNIRGYYRIYSNEIWPTICGSRCVWKLLIYPVCRNEQQF